MMSCKCYGCSWEDDLGSIQWMTSLARCAVRAVKTQSLNWTEVVTRLNKDAFECLASLDDSAEHTRIDSKERNKIWATGSRTLRELERKNRETLARDGSHPTIHEVAMVAAEIYDVLRCADFKAYSEDPCAHVGNCASRGCAFDKFAAALERAPRSRKSSRRRNSYGRVCSKKCR